MAPKPKPGPTPELWKRTGKCLALKCRDCEAFISNGKQDGFLMCMCGHSQHVHLRVAVTSDKVVS